jgi:UDP-N-acetylmuramyl pentapeptide synthase
VNTLEELARAKQVVMESVLEEGHGVLNADDPLVAEMAAACARKVVYFSTNARNPILASHMADGGAAVYVQDNALLLHSSDTTTSLVEFDRLAFTAGGKIRFQVQNALAATAAAWAAGLKPRSSACSDPIPPRERTPACWGKCGRLRHAGCRHGCTPAPWRCRGRRSPGRSPAI